VSESILRVLRACLSVTGGPLTTHELAQTSSERFGLSLTERQAAHWMGELAKDGVVEHVDDPCAVCGGRGHQPKWQLVPPS
jgi:hypothetical protein